VLPPGAAETVCVDSFNVCSIRYTDARRYGCGSFGHCCELGDLCQVGGKECSGDECLTSAAQCQCRTCLNEADNEVCIRDGGGCSVNGRCGTVRHAICEINVQNPGSPLPQATILPPETDCCGTAFPDYVDCESAEAGSATQTTASGTTTTSASCGAGTSRRTCCPRKQAADSSSATPTPTPSVTPAPSNAAVGGASWVDQCHSQASAFLSQSDSACRAAAPGAFPLFQQTFASKCTDVEQSIPASKVQTCEDLRSMLDHPQRGFCVKCYDQGSSSSSCFDKEATHACLVTDPVTTTAASAYAQCFGGSGAHTAGAGGAKLVLMKSLQVGDNVLASRDAISRIVVNQHSAFDSFAPMLTMRMSNGAALSITPDHALFLDGRLQAASEVRVGSTLTNDRGTDATTVLRVTHTRGRAVINPVTVAGTILATDKGTPVLAASHPIWISPLLLASPAARTAANVALAIVGDSCGAVSFAAVLVVKILAALAVVRLAKASVNRGTSTASGTPKTA